MRQILLDSSMASPDHQLTGTGKIVVYSIIAIAIYALFSFIPAFDYQWLVALLVLAVISVLVDSASFNLPAAKPAAARSGTQLKGSIKWFNGTKGYGFIAGDDGAEVFVHFKSVNDVDKRRIKPGQRFSYNVVDSDRGPQAEDVTPL
jgi:cold shock protein